MTQLRPVIYLIVSLYLPMLVQPAGAETGDPEESYRACLGEVREEMLRSEVKSLDPKVQEAVAGLCRRGDTEAAVLLAVPAAGPRRCSLRVSEAASQAEPKLSREEVGKAYQLCRRGDTEAALGIVEAARPAEETAEPPARPPAKVPPNIFRFQARPPVVRRGEASRLTWDVYGTREVSLDGEAVPARGEKLVKPTRTTRYVLEAGSGRQMVEEVSTVRVSPFPPMSLASPIRSIELCRDVDRSGDAARCLSSDGPFWAGDPMQVIVRFAEIAAGEHHLEYKIFAGVPGSTRWTLLDRATGRFRHRDGRPAETTFEVPGNGKGTRKIEIVLDRLEPTRSEIRYCVECPGHDEW